LNRATKVLARIIQISDDISPSDGKPFAKGSLPCVSCADYRLAAIGLVCDWFWHSRIGKQNDYTLSLNEEPTFYRSEGDDRTEKNEEKPL
jgi:hypothetical protein